MPRPAHQSSPIQLKDLTIFTEQKDELRRELAASIHQQFNQKAKEILQAAQKDVDKTVAEYNQRVVVDIAEEGKTSLQSLLFPLIATRAKYSEHADKVRQLLKENHAHMKRLHESFPARIKKELDGRRVVRELEGEYFRRTKLQLKAAKSNTITLHAVKGVEKVKAKTNGRQSDVTLVDAKEEYQYL